MKFTTISKIPNISQMLIIPFLSMHYNIEKEQKNLQKMLKSAANQSLGRIKRRNRRKYLKIWDDQIKQLIETKKKIQNG